MKGWIGLCLALTFVVVGCRAAPQSAFSHDGKWIAYSEASSEGITVAETANPTQGNFYKSKNAGTPCWSNTGRYLVWASSQPGNESSMWGNTILLNVQAKKAMTLPVHIGGPFVWDKDDSTFVGFSLDGPMPKNPDEDHMPNMKRVTFDIVKNKKVGEFPLGKYLPAAVYPSGDIVLAGEHESLARLQGDTITPIMPMDKNAKGNPSGFSSDGRILWVQSIYDGGANKAFYADDAGHKENIALPPALTRSIAGEALVDISPDIQWLVVTKAETKIVKSGRRGMIVPAYVHRYSVMNRKSGRSMAVCSVSFKRPNTSSGTSSTWSDDSHYLCFGLDPQEGTDQIWLVDLEKWTKRKLPLRSR